MSQIITDEPRSGYVPIDIHYKLLVAFLLVGLIGIACGYAIGVRDGGNHVRAIVECDTDTDCLEKNGCGGYADPCTEEGN